MFVFYQQPQPDINVAQLREGLRKLCHTRCRVVACKGENLGQRISLIVFALSEAHILCVALEE